MALAVFDLDETLTSANSPSLWSRYLGQHGWLDADQFMAREQEMVRLYQARQLTLEQYFDFTLQPLINRHVEEVAVMASAFAQEVMAPLFYHDALACLERHRKAGDVLIVLSASPRFLVQAICQQLPIEHLLGSELEVINGCYSGRTQGILTYREGKIHALAQWAEQHQHNHTPRHFYSDSQNDLPLLCAVEYPHAVNPDPQLRQHAQTAGWDILSWG